MKDIHEEYAKDFNIMAGIGKFNVVVKSSRWTLFTEIELMVPVGNKRGVHMSRLILPAMVNYESIEQFITETKNSIHAKIGNFPYIKVRFKFPWRDQFPTITIETDDSGRNIYTYTLLGTTACPCSKEYMGIGHMQKCELLVAMLANITYPKFEDIFKLIDSCFSAALTEKLKRNEEAAKIKEAQDNAKFVEDVVRSAVRSIPDIMYARAESDESIHAHKAIAEWRKS